LVRGLASPIVGDTIRALVALIFLLTLVAGLIGVQDSVRNLIVPMIWVIWWVGFSFASVLFGNIWPSVNPLRTLFTARNSRSPLSEFATIARGGLIPRRSATGRRRCSFLASPGLSSFGRRTTPRRS
jgi:hypothetical protein